MKQQQMAVAFIFCGVSQKLCSTKEGSMTKLHQHFVSQEHSFHESQRTQLQSAVSFLPYLSFTCSSVMMLIGHLWVRCLLDVCATGHSQRWANKAHGKVQKCSLYCDTLSAAPLSRLPSYVERGVACTHSLFQLPPTELEGAGSQTTFQPPPSYCLLGSHCNWFQLT